MRYRLITPFLFIAPMIIGLLVFRLLPIAASFLASFTHWNVFSSPIWAWTSNYRELLHSPRFWEVLKNTGIFAVLFVPGVMVIGLALALLVNQRIKATAFFRGLFFMPYITSIVAIALVWKWIFATQYGILNFLLGSWFDVANPPSWLGDSHFSLLSVAIVYVWQSTGFQMLLFLAGLQNLDMSLEEAARIDGANELSVFRAVILPLMKPAIAVVAIFAAVNAWNDFLTPLIYLQEETRYPLSIGLQFFRAEHNIAFSLLMAASTLVVLPVIALFLLFQRFFIEGVTVGAIKG